MSEGQSTDSAFPLWLRRLGLAEIATPGATREAVVAGVGGAAAIGFLAACEWASVTPLIMAPFGASCVLLFNVPGSPLAQPRNVIGGHILCALIGIAALVMLGQTPIAMAAGVGVSIAAMRLTGTLHPPAGAVPIVIVAAGSPWWFVFAPVGVGATVLVLFAWFFHRFISGNAYPKA